MSASTTRPDFTAAMSRLRQIALTSADNALTEGPVNPDRQLLDLCAEALHSLKHAEKARGERNDDWYQKQGAEKQAALAADRQRLDDWWDGTRAAKPAMARIRKMKATTAAGIYAKAAVVRASRTGAADLAMSLAEDLLAAPGLRSALWPAEDTE